tara:strand:- start:95 stop:580 length:486 start_codon:yes stop_codon:yes gene_type:complete
MRLFIYLVILFFLSSCTTIEVTKEVVKVGNVVKEKVEGQFQKEEVEVVEDNTIVKEQQIISEEKEEEKTIVKTQQKLAQINFIGKKINEIESQMGTAELTRSDGIVYTMRYDSKSCRLFLFFGLNSNTKRVEHFEFRDSFGDLLDTKKSLEVCYKEYSLVN